MLGGCSEKFVIIVSVVVLLVLGIAPLVLLVIEWVTHLVTSR